MKQNFLSLGFLMLTILTLSSCGFEPLYGSKPSGSQKEEIIDDMSKISIAIIPDRDGQKLRNLLIDRLYQNGYPQSPDYILNVAPIAESLTELDITKSADATRGQLRLQTTMQLSDSSQKILLTRNIQTIATYNILGSEFATRVSEDNARNNGIQDLARQIESNLSLYLKQK
jgi:LPS-assembly lipoprotein